MFKTYFFDRSKRSQQIGLVLVVLMVAGVGMYMLTASHAATPYASTAPDKGTLASGATVQSCSGASDGSCVVFGGSTTNTIKMIGINGTYGDPNYVQDSSNLGVKWIRVGQWGEHADFTSDSTGGVATLLAAHNIHMLPLVNDYSTSWVTAGGRQTWTNQVAYTATTYAKGGTFWKGKTDYGSPVIEVSNEAWNTGYPWPDQQWLQPGDYALMLKQAAIAVNLATSGRIKLVASVQPQYTTAAGKIDDWSQDMKATVPDIESFLGGVAEHPYGDIPSIGLCSSHCANNSANFVYPNNLNTIHSDWTTIPVYITEVGEKAGSTAAGNGQVGYATQCQAMNLYFNDFKKNSWEAGLFWFNQKDYQAYNSSSDNGWALIDNTGFHKPAWYAYQAQATNLAQYNC